MSILRSVHLRNIVLNRSDHLPPFLLAPHRTPSTDGRMLLWDPVAANTPVASVAVGCPLNSACFSAGDPYALICAPELGMGCVGGGRARSGRSSSSTGGEMCNDLVQIWDLR